MISKASSKRLLGVAKLVAIGQRCTGIALSPTEEFGFVECPRTLAIIWWRGHYALELFLFSFVCSRYLPLNCKGPLTLRPMRICWTILVFPFFGNNTDKKPFLHQHDIVPGHKWALKNGTGLHKP